jgi:squamous cell carcinoma antigen recognized by T-cells 3
LKILPEDHNASATATIEFDSKEDVLTAQTKDMKIFDGNAIDVQVGTGSTLFVTNFPPTADEGEIRDMFAEVTHSNIYR